MMVVFGHVQSEQRFLNVEISVFPMNSRAHPVLRASACTGAHEAAGALHVEHCCGSPLRAVAPVLAHGGPIFPDCSPATVSAMTDEPDSNRRPDGKFAAGNRAGGRKPGSRTAATVLSQAITAENRKALIEKCVAQALGGDTQLLKAFLDRIDPAPRGRFIQVPVPLPPGDVAFEVILNAVGGGLLTSSEAVDLAKLLESRQGATEIADLAARIISLEERLHVLTSRPD